MRLFRKKTSETHGWIGHFNLSEWWFSAFTDAERDYIENVYAPIGGSSSGGLSQEKGTLTNGKFLGTSQTVSGFLSSLSTWFRKTEQDRDIARRILAKSVEVSDPSKDILGLHFTYSALVEVWYRDRETLLNARDEAILACKKQIQIALQAAQQFRREYPNNPLPSHVGYTQLTIIYDKEDRLDEAIQIAQQAQEQGWNGDWDNRIERYRKKRAKQTNSKS